MGMRSILDAAIRNYSNDRPFVLFSKPNSPKILGLFDMKPALQNAQNSREEGFIFAPFDKASRSYFISKNGSTLLESDIMVSTDFSDSTFELPADHNREHYLTMLQKTIAQIKATLLNKVVISRKRSVTVTNFDLVALAKSIFSNYPDAFRYLWFHPETGIWCGATPELLLRVDQSTFGTMSLAGTLPFVLDKEPVWGQKELNEQRYVTEAILEDIAPFTQNISASAPYNKRAGKLWHLRSDISGIVKSDADIWQLVHALHPTPAVCGSPRNAAYEFIHENEGYDREFYAGYLGPVYNKHSETSLYVNLRCAKIGRDTASIYVGGGITAESDSASEWEETCQKQQTMLKVLRPFL